MIGGGIGERRRAHGVDLLLRRLQPPFDVQRYINAALVLEAQP
jgi:hypothetical protein